jgi:tungstate transport system substrate-binding protein
VYKRQRQDLAILVEGDERLLNPYGSLLVNPASHPHVKAEDARIWHDWLTSAAGRRAIASFTIDGEQLFFPSPAAGQSLGRDPRDRAAVAAMPGRARLGCS